MDYKSDSLRVLVVDDNRPSADSLAMLLEALGHEAQVAYDGQSAMVVWQDIKPQIAFIDLRMPGEDGYSVAHRLRQAPPGNHSFLVALSGYAPGNDDPRWAESAFDDFVLKPIALAQLQTLLERSIIR